jgi:hypothetical protein
MFEEKQGYIEVFGEQSGQRGVIARNCLEKSIRSRSMAKRSNKREVRTGRHDNREIFGKKG